MVDMSILVNNKFIAYSPSATSKLLIEILIADAFCLSHLRCSPYYLILSGLSSPKAATLSMMSKTGYTAVHGMDEEVQKRWTVLASFVSQVEDKTIIRKLFEL